MAHALDLMVLEAIRKKVGAYVSQVDKVVLVVHMFFFNAAEPGSPPSDSELLKLHVIVGQGTHCCGPKGRAHIETCTDSYRSHSKHPCVQQASPTN